MEHLLHPWHWVMAAPIIVAWGMIRTYIYARRDQGGEEGDDGK